MNTVAIKEFAFDYILQQDNLSKSEKILLGTYVKESDKYQVMHLLAFGTIVPPMTEEMNKDIQIFYNCLSEIDWRTVGVDASVKAGSAIEKGVSIAKSAAGKKALQYAYDPMKGSNALKRLAASWANYKVSPGSFNIGAFTVKIPKLMNRQWHLQYVQANAAIHAGVALAALAATTMIFMAAKKAYKATLSKAARSCRKYEGKNKGECIRKFHVDALKHDISVMMKNKEVCKATKKPEKCAAKVNKRIAKQKARLQKALITKKPKKL